VDSAGQAVITGMTTSDNFPTRNPAQARYAGNTDAYVCKLNAAGSDYVYSTYLGGAPSRAGSGGTDVGTSITVDKAGGAYIFGLTSSSDFPVRNAFQRTLKNVGGQDAFITKLDGTGAMAYSTYLGGSESENFGPFALLTLGFAGFSGIAVDNAGAAYVTGTTFSPDFPLKNPIQDQIRGFEEVFLGKLDPTGSNLVFSTFLGGDKDDESFSIALDAAGSVYLAGAVFSTNFPIQSGLQPVKAGGNDALLVKISDESSAPMIRIASFGFSAGNDFSLQIAAPAGRTFRLETSTDLRAWSLLTEFQTVGGTFTYTDPAPRANQTRFYRARTP
jgi:hypothetical protein